MHQEKYLKYIKLSTTITSIETTDDGFISTTQDNASILSKYVLITNGGGMFIPRPLGIKDEERFENLHYHIKDASLFKHKKLIMFGGGDTATDWAHYFMKQGSNVTIVHRRDDFRGDESLIKEIKENIWYDFKKDNNFTELKEAELLQSRLGILQIVDPYVGRYYSMSWVKKNVLHLDEEEIQEMQGEMDQENAIVAQQQADQQQQQLAQQQQMAAAQQQQQMIKNLISQSF